MSMASSKNLRKVVNKVLFLNQYTPTWRHIRNHSYTNVYMKWKSDSYFDSIESIHKSIQLKPIIALKNRITASPDSCIPVSDVSKKGIQLEIPIKVARFLRLYPSVFEEFTGPKYNLPWFRLTPEAAILHDEEQAVYRDFKADLQERLRKLILMSVENKLPLKIIKGMLWYLGLPEDYLDGNVDECFKVVEMGDGMKGLSAVQTKKTLSVIQKNALRTGVYNGGKMEYWHRKTRKIGTGIEYTGSVPVFTVVLHVNTGTVRTRSYHIRGV
ncbi:putative plant organelle RNA recognition domain-containing protein [Helianthus annuus]|nr:putative plant organelle RNA recognition domain-containing protein [Helianthus annuus]KAJ0499489.1 putative plant organelle RNA recognition domain-containing protein [Helianthus annuus]KAJ0672946.1 putative plant organelle RNA recognition domain-containing protein [Helianthus annuus]